MERQFIRLLNYYNDEVLIGQYNSTLKVNVLEIVYKIPKSSEVPQTRKNRFLHMAKLVSMYA